MINTKNFDYIRKFKRIILNKCVKSNAKLLKKSQLEATKPGNQQFIFSRTKYLLVLLAKVLDQ